MVVEEGPMTPHHHTITAPHRPPNHPPRAPGPRPPAKKPGDRDSGPASWAAAPRATWPATERRRTSSPGTQAAGSGTSLLTTTEADGPTTATITAKGVPHGARAEERDRRDRRGRRIRLLGMRALGLDRRVGGEGVRGSLGLYLMGSVSIKSIYLSI